MTVIPSKSGFTTFESLPPGGRVHIVGAGPVGLLLAALLQSVEDVDVRLYEKRRQYTRSRMVKLAPYLVADSFQSYRADPIDGENVDAVFDPSELEEAIAFRRSIPADLLTLLRGWTLGFCPLNAIEQSLSDLIDERSSNSVQRTSAVVTAPDAMAMLDPGDMLIDCTGSKSVLRDHLVPGFDKLDGAANTYIINRGRSRDHVPL
jgi:flavin-dependent dehydrogenase